MNNEDDALIEEVARSLCGGDVAGNAGDEDETEMVNKMWRAYIMEAKQIIRIVREYDAKKQG